MAYTIKHITYFRWFIISILYLPFLLTTFVYSQDLSYRQFTIEDGLPSNQIYNIHQDQNGFIWFATENGLSRYNGESFVNYTLFDGLPDTEILNFFEDSKNRLWFYTLNGKLGYYKNGIFYNEHNTDFLKDGYLNNSIRNVIEDDEGNLYFSCNKLVIKINQQDELTKFDTPAHGKGMIKDKEGQIYVTKPIIDDSLSLMKIPSLELTPLKSINIDVENKYKLFFSRITDFSKIHPLSTSFSNLFRPSSNDFVLKKDDSYWLSSPLTALHVLEANEQGLLESTYSLDNFAITRGIIDREKYIWYGSLGQGVLRFDKSNAMVYRLGEQLEGEVLTSLFIDKSTKKIYCGTSDGVLNIISKDTIQTIKLEAQYKGNNRIRDIEKDNFDRLWLTCDRFLLAYDSKSLQADPIITSKNFLGAPKNITFDKTSNQLFIANNTWTFKYNYTFRELGSRKILLHKRSTYVHIDSDKQLWMGTSNGLFYFPKMATDSSYVSLGIDEPISCINHVGKTIIAGTKGKGILLINGDSIRRVSSDLGLPSNLIRSIYVDEDESVWIATNQGLCKIEDVHQPSLAIRVINKQNGLISDDIIDCGIVDSTLYVLCSQGLSVLNHSTLNNDFVPPNIKMEQILVNDKIISSDSIIRLASDQNNISFHFSGIHFGNRSKLEYNYKLFGYHENWYKTKNDNIVFEQIPPGKYRLELYATVDGIRSINTETIHFNIIPWFYQERVVQLLGLCFIISCLISFILYLFEKEKEKNKIEKRLIQLEQIALQSQMNPHFIKNSLGAIQHLMIKKDVRTANKYLTVFGELITQLLSQSDQSQIKVLDEIKILELYLSIEKLRFDNNFDYQICCDAKEILDHKIPSMMIQPLVENAIIHGFRDTTNQYNNNLNIQLYPKKNYLICTVEDNGSGIKAQSAGQSLVSKRQGIAIKNIKERISLLAIKYPSASFELIKTNSKGTLIKLCLPLSEYYD